MTKSTRREITKNRNISLAAGGTGIIGAAVSIGVAIDAKRNAKHAANEVTKLTEKVGVVDSKLNSLNNRVGDFNIAEYNKMKTAVANHGQTIDAIANALGVL